MPEANLSQKDMFLMKWGIHSKKYKNISLLNKF